MNALASLLSATPSPAAAAAKGDPADLPVAYEHDDSQFDDVMSQAMGTPAKARANGSGAQGNLPGQTSFSSHQAAQADAAETAADPSSLPQTVPDPAGVKTSPKDSGEKISDPAGTTAATAAGNGSPDPTQLINGAQNLPMPLLAPAFSSYLPIPAKGGGGAAGAISLNESTAAANAGGNILTTVSTSASAALATATAKSSPEPKIPGPSSNLKPAQTGASDAKSLAAGLAPLPDNTPAKSQIAGLSSAGDLSLPTGLAATTTASDQPLATHQATHAATKDPAAALGKTTGTAAAAAAISTSISASSAKTAGTDLPPVPADATSGTQETPANAGPDVNLTAHAFPPAHGTLAAKQDVQMKKADNTIKVAGQSEKVLPGAVLSPARVSSLPVRESSATPAPAHDSTLGSNIIPFSPTSERGADSATAAGSLSVSSLDDIRTRALDRTQDMVALHAVRLVESNTDSLSVVIKPGAGLQLSLQLTQGADGITAQAVLQHGDFENLNRHWPELQDRLEQRGIKLAPLTSDEASLSFGNQNRGQQSRQQAPEEKALYASAFAEFSLAGVSGAAAQPALASLAAGGWQSWA